MSTQETTVVAVESFTIEQINKAIESMARAQAGAITTISKVMVMAIWASIANKDAGVANALLKNLRKGMKKVAVTGVLEQCGNLAYISGNFVYFDAHKVWDVESSAAIKAKCAAWETFKPAQPEPQATDVADALAEFCDRMVKLDGKALLKHAELLTRVQQLSAAFSSEIILEVNTSN